MLTVKIAVKTLFNTNIDSRISNLINKLISNTCSLFNAYKMIRSVSGRFEMFVIVFNYSTSSLPDFNYWSFL